MAEKKTTAAANSQLPPLPYPVDRDVNGSKKRSIPKPIDVIMSYPPPENTRKYDVVLSQLNKQRRRVYQKCLLATVGVLFFLVISAAIAAAVIYIVLRPRSPDFAVADLSIQRMNLVSSLLISPEFDVTIRVVNSKNKLGIDYLSGGRVQVLYGGVPLAEGALPVFYQPSKNVTVYQTALVGPSIVLGESIMLAMEDEEKNARVPLQFKFKAPVKVRVGSVNSWKIIVKGKCDIAVDALTDKAKVVSQHCEARLN